MKTIQPILQVLCLVVAIICVDSKAFAQNKGRLPPELNQSSSLREVLEWLDKNSFSHARVGLNDSGMSAITDDTMGTLWEGRSSEKRVFSQGFKLVHVEGCTARLRNDDVRLIRNDSKAHKTMVDTTQTQIAAELYLPLYRLSDRKGKSPYRHTKDPEKARLLGTWRTEFTYKGFFSKEAVQIATFTPGYGERKSLSGGETVTFTFDDKEMSERFDAAFRQAIRLCRKK